MCLTVPRQVIKIKGNKAQLQDKRWVNTQLVGKVEEGDVLLVQADMAIEKVAKEKAVEMSNLMED